MRFGSVCSGIESASVAWEPLGWNAAWFSEIEPFPCSVLKHHYPTVPNLGDMTKYEEWPDDAIDILVGGTPCQSFSVAGLRKGLDDPRGNLMLTFGAIAKRYHPEWLVWENVPGVLSSNGGRDFGTFLGMLGELGYGFAYRVLDAQYFGVAQRRRRVFVVANARGWTRAAAVLFERESLSGHPAPRRGKGEETAKCLTRGVGQRFDPETETHPVAGYTSSSFGQYDEGVGTVRAHGGDIGGGSETIVAFGWQNSASQGDSVSADVTPTLDKSKTPAVAFGGDLARTLSARHDSSPCADRGMDVVAVAGTMKANNGGGGWSNSVDHAAAGYMTATMNAVRRLTPRECERLQGFPDDYTQIPHRGKPAADGPRYKALGNSMAVPVMAWIGEKIMHVESIK